MSTLITSIDRRSPAERAGVRPGERLLSINSRAVEDVLDYRFFGYDANPLLELEAPDGSRRSLRVKKPEGTDLGLNFETYLMDKPRPCANHCLFCFVDQMAPGCRDTLYFKDDDARLSFLMGNYITLTNLSDREVRRIIELRISPINVSVHATDPKLRSVLLGSRAGGESLAVMRRLGEAGIAMNGQIVLCPGYNDGEQLQRTMEDMAAWGFNSCSIVPVGLTKFREGLSRLRPVDRETANQVIGQVDAFGARCLERYGSRKFFCSDELYIRAGRDLPEEAYYEEYVQIENGVGMLRLLRDEFQDALGRERERLFGQSGKDREKQAGESVYGERREFGRERGVQEELAAGRISLATGKLAFSTIREMADQVMALYPHLHIHVYEIINRFFGEKITVSGLLTGQDIMEQLQGKELGERLLLPINMLRSGTDVFLDDVTVGEVEKTLQVRVDIVKSSGYDLLSRMLGRDGIYGTGED